MRHAHIFFLSPLVLSLFEAPESSKVFTTGTKASCILTSAGKQNRVARQGSFKRQLRPFCSLLFMYKLQIAFANIFFKIKSSFLSFLQAPGARIKLMALMETRGGRGGATSHALCRGSGHTLLTPSRREKARERGCSYEVHHFPTPGSCGTICSQSPDPPGCGSATHRF